ncbi:TAXI family TRAP transporter solute-binding subunit [Arenicella xantha]|uniref:TRAP transporter TAXI family solute receptor n=1 Tax=Arenicella xantha TaxID=644221 RepID=A0A395JSC0_9GAMM|nr:TAXI family TRAP transporter solute-binding subunit [Arenicella xantha]RBP53356.1 hypothetical protein DFR28_101742 [Arenicella xantha]
MPISTKSSWRRKSLTILGSKRIKLGRTVRFTILCLLMVLSWTNAQSAAPKPEFIVIGTGGLTGVYYPAGGAICRIVNRYRKEQGIRCSVESTRGSVANLNTLGDGDIDLAIAQSDTQYHAYNGTDVFTKYGANKNLRTVFNLHAEPFTVVASERSGIKTFDDLKGKRVNIGRPGSGQRQTMNALMRAKGWTSEDFASVHELTSIDHSRALCDDIIDAFVYSVGHPAGSIKEAANGCKIRLIPVTGEAVDSLINSNRYYQRMRIAGDMYRGNKQDTETIGVRASLIASQAISPDLIYLLVKDVFENLGAMQKMHPAFKSLEAAEMAPSNPLVPLHDGAKRYFSETGMLPGES